MSTSPLAKSFPSPWHSQGLPLLQTKQKHQAKKCLVLLLLYVFIIISEINEIIFLSKTQENKMISFLPIPKPRVRFANGYVFRFRL